MPEIVPRGHQVAHNIFRHTVNEKHTNPADINQEHKFYGDLRYPYRYRLESSNSTATIAHHDRHQHREAPLPSSDLEDTTRCLHLKDHPARAAGLDSLPRPAGVQESSQIRANNISNQAVTYTP